MSNAGQKFPPEVLPLADVRALLSAMSPRTFAGVRNRAMVALMWRAGLRITECLRLRPSDIDAERNTVRVVEGKGGRYRVVAADDEAFALVGAWLERRRSLGVDGRRPLFCTRDGNAISSRYVRTMLRRIARKAGVDRRVHPHGFRHTFASELVEEGQSLNVVQESLGHGSVVTTALYLKRIAPANLVEVARNRPKWTADDDA